MKSVIRPLQCLPTLALCWLVSNAATAQQDAHDQALRELNIMSNIFGAALAEDGNRNGLQRSQPDALYLAEQGMVFTFDLADGNGIRLFIPNMENLNNLGNFSDNFDFDFDFDFDYETFGGDSAALSEQAEAYREQLRAMNEQMRARQQELRDAQRELRDIQRRNGDNAEEIARLQGEIETQSGELESVSNDYDRLQQEFEAERDAALAQRQDEQSMLIFDTLCVYGNTLRTLQSGQHVSLVLRNFADDRAQVYVLSQPAVASCSSADALRQGAIAYQIPE